MKRGRMRPVFRPDGVVMPGDSVVDHDLSKQLQDTIVDAEIIQVERLKAEAEIERLRSEALSRGNALGRIAIALFGDHNNRSDEECVAAAAEVGYSLAGCRERCARLEADLERLRGLLREALDEHVHVPYGASHEDVAAIRDFEKRVNEAL